MVFNINIDASKKRIGLSDNDNHKQLVKIGREIHRMKQLDGINKHRIEREFSKDANKLITKKEDNTVCKKVAKEITNRLMEGR